MKSLLENSKYHSARVRHKFSKGCVVFNFLSILNPTSGCSCAIGTDTHLFYDEWSGHRLLKRLFARSSRTRVLLFAHHGWMARVRFTMLSSYTSFLTPNVNINPSSPFVACGQHICKLRDKNIYYLKCTRINKVLSMYTKSWRWHDDDEVTLLTMKPLPIPPSSSTHLWL